MAEAPSEPTDAGVIIGRFQVHELHAAHKEIIEHVRSKHKKTIILLGNSPVPHTRRNPLDFTSRMLMIQEEFPDVVILPILDMKSDDEWSKQVDFSLRSVNPTASITLYGGRDSFIPHYKGKFRTEELEPSVWSSGTEVRKSVSHDVMKSPLWRAGVIYAAHNRYVSPFPCVDIAVLKGKKLLLARKPHEDQWRFPGGHVEPGENYEEAAKRELHEEVGQDLETSSLRYLGSYPVDDWRYDKLQESVSTALFVCDHVFGHPDPDDDIEECGWFDIKGLDDDDIVEAHLPLWHTVRDYANLSKADKAKADLPLPEGTEP